MDQFLKGITSTIGNAAQGVGNFFSQQFTPAVQRFGQMAEQDLARAPLVGGMSAQQLGNMAQPVVNNVEQAAVGLGQGIGQMGQGIAKEGMQYFNPENQGGANNPTPNFWNTPAAQMLGGQIKLPTFNFAEQYGQQANKNFGGGIPGAIAGTAASALPGMVEGILNVPSQIGQAAIDTGNAIDDGTITKPQKYLGLASEFAQPLLTVATLGKAPELLAGVKDASWGMSALKGLLNGSMYGGGFGALQGLQQGQNAKDLQSQIQQALPYIGQGMVMGGTLGTVLGPAGKFFFGNKEPGQTATLAQNGLVPPETMDDAYRILGVSPDASLEDIRTAYAKAVQEFHPKFGGTPESLDVLNNAYEMTTRNTAPTVQFDKQNNPYLTFSDEFGNKTLTQEQVAQARRAAADHTAFQARIDNLKAGKTPIEGTTPGQITEDQFLQHGADLLTPESQQAILNKTQQAAANQPAFHDLLDTVGQEVKGRTISNIKTPKSIAQKIVGKRIAGEPDYNLGNVQDTLRGTIVVNSKDDLDQAIQSLQNELQNRGWQRQGGGQNYFQNPQASGYEGYHLNIGMPDGTIGEVQIHTPQSFAQSRLTHGIYDQLGENIPKGAKVKLDALKAKIKTDPVADLEAATHQNELNNPSQVLSPMESNFTGRPQPLTEAGQIAQRLQEVNPNTDYRALNYQEQNAQTRNAQQSAAVDQTRVKLQNQPQSIEEQAAQQARQWNDIATQQHYVDNLVRIRDGMQEKIDAGQSETSPEIDGMLQQRAKIQQEIDQAKDFVEQNRNNPAVGRTIARPAEIRAHIKDLSTTVKNIDDQVKVMQSRLKVRNAQQAEGLKAQVQDLNRQIEQEQARVRLGKSQTQPMQLPGMMTKEQVQDILNREPSQQPEISTQQQGVPNTQGEQQSPSQQAFQATQTGKQAETPTAKPQPAGAPKETGVFTFSPAEGGPAKTGTPAELGLTRSSKTSNVWEDENGNQYIANYNPEKEKAYKQDAGLPTLKSPEELQQSGQLGKAKIGASFKPKKGISTTLENVMIPLTDEIRGSKDVRAQQLLQGVKDAQNWSDAKTNEVLTPLEKARKALSPEDYQNATRSLEGKEQPKNQAVAAWVAEAKKAYDTALTLEQKSGIPVRKLDNYYTHTYTKDQIDAMSQDPDVIQGVISEGNATNPSEASAWIRNHSRQISANEYGSLHNSRLDRLGKYQYIEDPRVVEDYIKRGMREAGFTSVFGENMGKAAQLINAMRNDGNAFDAANGQKLLEVTGATYATGKDPDAEAFQTWTQGIHDAEALTKLGLLTPLHHGTSIPALGARVGFRNTVAAVPDLLKGLAGNFSDEARLNVNRLHNDNTADLYGRPTSLLQKGKFYSAIGLNRVLDALSAMGSKAALLRVGELEKNLSDPATIRDIQHAGLDANAIQQRGYFTPEEKNSYVNAALKDASLMLSPEDMPKFYNSPAGRVVGMFKGPLIDRTFKMYPYLLKEVQSGNIAPIVGFVALSTLAGAMEQQAGNVMQNRPQQTLGQLVQSGFERGVLPVGGEEIANALQYPEFAPKFTNNQTLNALLSAGISTAGGPFASDAMTALTTYNNFNSQNPNDKLTAERQLVREIPIAGPLLANTFLPYKSYVGNRPSDIIGTLATGNKPQQQQGITVQHSPLDLLRANPQVAQQQAALGKMYDAQNAAIGKLSQTQQANYTTMKNAFATGDYQTGYKLMAQDPALYDARAAVEQASAKANGTKVNPLYDSANKQQATNYLKFQNMTADQQSKYLTQDQGPIAMERQIDQYKQDPKVQAADKQAATAAGSTYRPYVANPLFATNSQTGKPLFSDQEIASYRVYQNLPTTGTQKVEWMGNHPEIMGEQLATQNYQLQKLQSDWDNRPKGQSLGEFAATHQSALFGGIDQNGKVIPAYNLFEEPKYQVYMQDPQKGAVIAAYNAFVANKNYTQADALAAQNSDWFPLYQQANKMYVHGYIDANGVTHPGHPYNSETAGQLGGAGIDFAGTGGSGYGGSGGGSSNYMNNYLERQSIYSVLHDTQKAVPALSLTKPLGVPSRAMFKNPYDAFAQQQTQNLARILGTMPKLEAAPKLNAPKIQAVENKIKISPAIPAFANGSVQPAPTTGRLSY